MPYMTKRQLIKAHNTGDLEGVRKQLTTYGTITADASFEIESGHYAGANRITHFTHHGDPWRVDMLNGEVRSLARGLHHV
jgi:hypothetical protein